MPLSSEPLEIEFRSIVEQSSDAVIVLDAQGRITYHSPSLAQLLAQEFHGRELCELVHAEDASSLRAFVENPLDVIDVRIRHRDASWRWLSLVATRSALDCSLIVNARDVTGTRLMVGQLAATVAHEFNNVLMGIQPFAELMLRPGIDPEFITRGARTILTSIARGKRVSHDMLRFAHPVEPKLATLELRAWWRDAASELKEAAGPTPIECAIPRQLAVLADGAQLTIAIAQLVSNARDAISRNGRITIVARHPGAEETFAFGVVRSAHNFVQLSVADNGCGMSDEVARRALDPLFTTKSQGATGLGLAIVQQIVTRHGGSLFVQSAPQQGTTIHLFLPRVANTDVCPEIEHIAIAG